MRKILLLFIALFISAVMTFAAEITAENYQRYIGKNIKFNPNIEAGDSYKIGRKAFNNKKYSGVVLTISNIERDKKGNLVIFLTHKLEEGKTKEIKIKAKASKAELQNIAVIEDIKPKTKPKATKPLSSVQGVDIPVNHQIISYGNNRFVQYDYNELDLGFPFRFLFFILLFFTAFPLVFLLLSKVNNADTKLIETVTMRPNNGDMGSEAEKDLILKLLKGGIPSETIFHDLYIKKYGGGFSQVDVVAITDVGIIVFEVKDYSGWIFGNGKHTKWTKVLAYGKEKYRFYNPIMQNNWHIYSLRKELKPFSIPFYSIIVFYGDCELKDISFVPEGTFIVKAGRVLEVIKHILSKNNTIRYVNKNEVVKRLQAAVKNGAVEGVAEQHVENVEDMLGKDRVFK